MTRLARTSYLAVLAVVLIVPVRMQAAESPDAPTGAARPAPVKGEPIRFTCPKDRILTVAFVTTRSGEQAIVQPPDGAAVTLPVQLSGSGFRYADDTHELRGKGRAVTWTDEARRPIVCTEQ